MISKLSEILRRTLTSKQAMSISGSSALFAVLLGMLGADSKVDPNIAFAGVVVLILANLWATRQAAHSNPDGTHASKPYQGKEKNGGSEPELQ